MLESQQDFHHAGHSRSSFQMADIRLHRAQQERVRRIVFLAEDVSQRAQFDSVAKDRARSVCLHIINLSGLQSRL